MKNNLKLYLGAVITVERLVALSHYERNDNLRCRKHFDKNLPYSAVKIVFALLEDELSDFAIMPFVSTGPLIFFMKMITTTNIDPCALNPLKSLIQITDFPVLQKM